MTIEGIYCLMIRKKGVERLISEYEPLARWQSGRELLEELRQQIDFLTATIEKAWAVIESLPDDERFILTERYIKDRPWLGIIQDAAVQLFLSERQIYRIHEKAILSVSDALNDIDDHLPYRTFSDAN